MTKSETTSRTEAGDVVAVVHIRGQVEPVFIRCLRPLPIVACDALPEADRLLSGARGLARRAPAAIASVHVATS